MYRALPRKEAAQTEAQEAVVDLPNDGAPGPADVACNSALHASVQVSGVPTRE